MSSKSKSSSSSSHSHEEKKAPPSHTKDLWQQAQELQNNINNPNNPTTPTADGGEVSPSSSSSSPPVSSPSLREASVVYVGPRGSGKSTLMQHFMFKDRDETPKPTTAWDYKFTKTSVKDSMTDEKSLSHFSEIGGGRSFISLLSVILTEKNISDTLMVIVLDLSAPSRILNDCQFFLQAIRIRCDEILKENAKRSTASPPLSSPLPDLFAKQRRQYGDSHADQHKIDVLPVSTMICLNKFDLSASQSPEALKQLTKALRYLAHTNGCHIMFTCRTQRDQFEKAYRQRLQYHIMNNDTNKKPTPNTDPTGPLYVVAGTDSLANIGDPPSSGTAKTPLGQWIFSMAKFYPPNESDKEVGSFTYHYNSDVIDLSNIPLGTSSSSSDDEFAEFSKISNVTDFGDLKLSEEKQIDSMMRNKEEDLRRLIRENTTKRKVAAVEVKVK